ncbi:MAG: DUF3422 domain-containing protein [Pseudomonadota bacterium]
MDAQPDPTRETDEPPPAAQRIERRYAPHPARAAVINEVHTRPFVPLPTPLSIFHFAFMNDAGGASADQERLVALLADRGLPPLPSGARHHRFSLPGIAVRWESHTEFTTYGFQVEDPGGAPFEHPVPNAVLEILSDPPGGLLVATRVTVRAPDASDPRLDGFDLASRCLSEVQGDDAVIATDLKPDAAGFTRFLVENHAMEPMQTGAVVQRLLEIETYRTLALLGLPEALKAGPTVRQIEEDLAAVTEEMRAVTGLTGNRALLGRLTELAGETEAIVAATSYRFSATRAYENIVTTRLTTLDEQALDGHLTLSAFLMRRMSPAMRTCQSTENRLEALSEKLTRAASLLRARVDVELESQNRDLLEAMNRRAQLQLRLQRTVEGLSVAAVTYYVVGLISYLAKGGAELGLTYSPAVIAAAAVPIVALVIGLFVRQIRNRHKDDEEI